MSDAKPLTDAEIGRWMESGCLPRDTYQCGGMEYTHGDRIRATVDALRARAERAERYCGGQVFMSDYRTADEMRAALLQAEKDRAVLGAEVVAWREWVKEFGKNERPLPALLQKYTEQVVHAIAYTDASAAPSRAGEVKP